MVRKIRVGNRPGPLEFAEMCEDLANKAYDLPSRMYDFRESVKDKCNDMAEWTRRNNGFTDKQLDAFYNMEVGVARVLERSGRD